MVCIQHDTPVNLVHPYCISVAPFHSITCFNYQVVTTMQLITTVPNNKINE
jgi:hypothetical protein